MSRYHSSISRAIVLAVVLGLILAGGGALVAPADAASQSAPTQTLILRSPGVATTYSIQVSGTITTGPQESSDTVRGQQVNGHLGGATDTQDGDATDFIKYTGYLTGFTANHSELHATLDGTLLNASFLDANHLQLKTDTSAQGPTRYTVTVTGTIVSGEATEKRDVPTNTTTVSGWLLPGDSDGFYFTGEIVSATSSVSRTANVRVNGQSQSLSSPSTPKPKPTPTRPSSRNTATSSPPRSSSTTQQSSHTSEISSSAVSMRSGRHRRSPPTPRAHG